ncbi:MAG: glycosyltransferase family 2 protein [Burkholderiales bacterium]|jgi:glycosyltransferase involved in cell wall biosynthesis
MILGIVIIGRNEGERLRACLHSVARAGACVVYVDSGSTDGSVELAQSVGVNVVPLTCSQPFTAARARNAGFSRLQYLAPEIRYVQFIDGDCEVLPGWLLQALIFLEAHPGVAAVCGRRRERFPHRSVYNKLCDVEWDTPIGEARSFGGDALVRANALREVGGYRDDLIAGEEPELCVRLRAAGWRLWRLPHDMTWHDAAMVQFSQWWKRTLRSGYAFAQGAHLHGAPPERHWVRESRRAWFWGLALPGGLLLFLLLPQVGHWALWACLIYPAQVLRLALRGQGPAATRLLRAFFLVLGRFPEALGQMRYWADQYTGRHRGLIEYKSRGTPL